MSYISTHTYVYFVSVHSDAIKKFSPRISEVCSYMTREIIYCAFQNHVKMSLKCAPPLNKTNLHGMTQQTHTVKRDVVSIRGLVFSFKLTETVKHEKGP